MGNCNFEFFPMFAFLLIESTQGTFLTKQDDFLNIFIYGIGTTLGFQLDRACEGNVFGS